MVATCCLALLFPLELLVVSFTVLGPLHYLTEIAWLHERRYFLPRRTDALLLAGLALAISGLGLARSHPEAVETAVVTLAFVALAGAPLLLAVRGTGPRVAGLTALAAVSLVVDGSSASYPWFVLVAILVPTFVHVLFFTAAFLLLGALRGRSWSGVISAGVLAGCLTILLATRAIEVGHEPSRGVLATFEAVFLPVREHVATLWPALASARATPFDLVFARVAAFAYATHYLNWFVKTSVIGWHRVPLPRLGAVGAGWMAALGLFAIAPGAGTLVLGALSLLHVVLELPLDARCLAGIAAEARAIAVHGWRR